MNDTETSSPPGPTGAAAPLSLRGIGLWPGFLGAREQAALMAEVAAIWDAAPPVRPVTRWGKPLSVAMTSAGSLGWTTDRRGYRYERAQPDGRAWPPIPPMLLALWDRVTGGARRPDSCLVNLYRDAARMGLHQDRDEADLTDPAACAALIRDARPRAVINAAAYTAVDKAESDQAAARLAGLAARALDRRHSGISFLSFGF